jgi:hypothetical protein
MLPPMVGIEFVPLAEKCSRTRPHQLLQSNVAIFFVSIVLRSFLFRQSRHHLKVMPLSLAMCATALCRLRIFQATRPKEPCLMDWCH